MITHNRVKYLGKTPRTFSTPIPFLSKSDFQGNITFDPSAVIPVAWAKHLFNECGDVWELVEEIDSGQPEAEPGQLEEMPLCECKCGNRLTWKKHYKYMNQRPRYISGHQHHAQSSAD